MPNASKNSFIPVNRPVLSRQARAYAHDCLVSCWLSSAGPYVGKFEKAFARFTGRKHAIGVANGTAALHTAAIAAGLGPGDEVLVPAFAMIAPAFAVMHTGAKPVFVDCELETLNMDPKLLEGKISRRTKAIIPVHTFGHPCEMREVQSIARKHRLLIIEDAAEAHGAFYRGRPAGSMGDLSCFSFYANKIVTMGEGGVVLTDNDKLAARARGARDLFHSARRRFIHEELGLNYRLTNIQAAIGLGELANIRRYIRRKVAIAARYTRLLSAVPGLRLPVTKPHVRNVFWMYAILVDPPSFGLSKDRLRHELAREGIETRDFFYPPDKQPALLKHLGRPGKFPNASFAARHGLYLPSGLGNTDREINRVASAILRLHKKHGSLKLPSSHGTLKNQSLSHGSLKLPSSHGTLKNQSLSHGR